ncbi:MAG: GAF domain-containing sensor histidine kinase [Chloroflexi bacterium]|nr:GAF domain-containing sensor histidine kinase [Chloroflexota bacterium]
MYWLHSLLYTRAVLTDSLVARVDRLTSTEIIIIILIALLALAAGWIGGRWYVLRRVRLLLKTGRAAVGSNRASKPRAVLVNGELGELTRLFNQMDERLNANEIERRRVENEIKQRDSYLAALKVVTAAASTSLELPAIFDSLKKHLGEQMDIPGGAIYFHNDAAGSLSLEFSWGLPDRYLGKLTEISAAVYPYQEVVTKKEPVLINDLAQAATYYRLGVETDRPQWLSYLCVPLISKGDVQGVIDLFSQTPYGFSQGQVALGTTIGQQVGVVIQNARLFEQIRSGRERLRVLSQEVLEAQEAERRHISRELHDEIGQALTAMKVNLQAVSRFAQEPVVESSILENINLIDRTLQQVRNLSLDLRPSLLDDLGVVAATRWYLDRQAQRARFTAHFLADPPELRLSPTLETTCFRVVQEAITNVVRHAQAKDVWVELKQRDAYLEINIRDDGIGFDVMAARERGENDTSLGLIGMEERVQLVGGNLQIKSNPNPGYGTEIRAVFPIPSVTPYLERRSKRRKPA